MATFFKNTELAAKYNISEATVRNWIKSASGGKLKLELVARGGRTYVTNSISNMAIIEKLVSGNRKYRNSLSAKIVTPRTEFGRIYSEAQIYDIVRNLEVYKEIPVQYNYFDLGAEIWNANCYAQLSADTSSMLLQSVNLLDENYNHIIEYLGKFKKLNVIDIGAGNAIPVRALIDRLIKQGRLNRYIAFDFSEDMLSTARQNLKSWFGEDFPFEGRLLDVSCERFSDTIAEGYRSPQGDLGNLVLFLGSTPMSLRSPEDAFRTIRDSLGPEDVLVYTGKLASSSLPEWLESKYHTEVARHRADWLSNSKLVFDESKIKDSFYFVLDKLNIDESFYTVEVGIDDGSRQRYAKAKLKYAVTVKFDFLDGKREIQFEKGDEIVIWRRRETTSRDLSDILESTGFYLLHSNQTADRNYILTISQVQRG